MEQNKQLPSLAESILQFVKNSPAPSFHIARHLQCNYSEFAECMEDLRSKGQVEDFELSLLGKKELIYYIQ
jgi:hypothetical protein